MNLLCMIFLCVVIILCHQLIFALSSLYVYWLCFFCMRAGTLNVECICLL